jgi:hypothetical protein
MIDLRALREKLVAARWALLGTTLAGGAVCGALIFSRASTAGFALVGPLVFVPYCLTCIGFTKPSRWMPRELLVPATVFLLLAAGVGLAWPLIVLFT